jgi:hypothetical protein
MITLLVAPALAAEPNALSAPNAVVSAANVTAMGGTGVASPDDNVGITLNPGMLGLERRYDVSALFMASPGEGIGWGATAVDARTSARVAAGIAYAGDRTNPPLTDADLPGWAIADEEISNVQQHHDITGAIAVPLLGRRLSVGVSVAASYTDHVRQGDVLRWDGHVGAGYRLSDAWSFGVAGRNLLPTAGSLPPELVAGARLRTEAFQAEVDGGWQDGAPALLAAGLEKSLGAAGRVRGGWRYEGGDHALSFGLGWKGQGGAIEYGLALPLAGKVRAASLTHVFSVRVAAPADIEEE